MKFLLVFVLVSSLAYGFPSGGNVVIDGVTIPISQIYSMDIPNTIRAKPGECINITERNKECSVGNAASWQGELYIIRILVISHGVATGLYINTTERIRSELLGCFANNNCTRRVFNR